MTVTRQDSREYTATKPRIRVEFTTVEGNEYEILGGDASGDILRISTNKTIDNPAGQWSIDLVGRKKYYQLLRTVSPDNFGPNGEPVYIQPDKSGYLRTFRPMGLVDIYINDNEVMLGTIDTIRKTVTMNKSGKPTVRLTITGRDLGGLLLDQKIWYDKNPETSQARKNTSLVSGYLLFNDFPPQRQAYQVLRQVYETWFSKVLEVNLKDVRGEQVVPFEWSDGSKVTDRLSCDSSFGDQTRDQDKDEGSGLSESAYSDFYQVNFTNWNFQGTIWDCLKQFTGNPFNELFVDTGGNVQSLHRDTVQTVNGKFVKPHINKKLTKKKCHVIFRPAPFNDSNVYNIESAGKGIINRLEIGDLPGHEINDFDIEKKSLGLTRMNSYSIYTVQPYSNILEISSGQYWVQPEYDSIALNKYGHNPFDIKVGGWNGIEKRTFTDEAEKLQILAKSWFMNNDLYLDGFFEVRGRSEIRVGHRLDYENNGKIDEEDESGYYYIRSVRNEWNYGQKFITKVGVSRGTSYNLREYFRKDIRDKSSGRKQR